MNVANGASSTNAESIIGSKAYKFMLGHQAEEKKLDQENAR